MPEPTPSGLAESLRDDQRRRWLSGRPVPVEEYLRSVPALAAAPEALLDLVYGEVLLREERGEDVRLEELVARFPEHAGSLARQWEVHQAIEAAGEDETPARPRVPGYEFLNELGRGGSGVVYLARQRSLNRLVAVKVLMPGRPLPAQQAARVRAEAELIARLQHPNIVGIYKVGLLARGEGGVPYLVLEYVPGGSLAGHLGQPWPAGRAAGLVETLARTLAVVHDQGIIHRDLKPANVLLTGEGVPKITDFGLARTTGEAAPAAAAARTEPGEMLGTPLYMAPEQARGLSDEVGQASDLHALGVILYELVAGRHPFRADNAIDVMARIAFEAPLPPSRLCPGLSPDLEAVILRCLEKKPTDRYGSALELAEDLHRVRNGFPSRARRVGLWGRARLWSRRQPAIAGLLVAVLLALVGGLASVGWQWRRAEAALRSASTAREDADRARVEAERAWAEEGATRVEVEKQREKLGALLGETQSLLSRSQVRLVEGHLARRQFALAQDDLIACPEPARDWEWRYLHRLCRVRLAELPAQPARAVAISPDGKRLATAGADVRLYEASTGKLLRTFEGHDTVAFLLEGLLVAVAPGGLRLLSADGASRRIEVPLDAGEIRHLAVCPKGRHLAAATSRRVLLYPLRDGKPGKPRDVVLSGTGGGLRGLAFSPDGKQLAIASGFQTRLWDVERREPVLLPTAKASSRRPVRMQARAVGVAWSSDGKWVVTAGADGILRGFSPTSGEEAFRLEGHTSAVQALASNGTNPPRLASVGQDGTARVWDLSARKEVAHLPGLRAVALNRAGDRLLASQRDGRVVLWATRPPDPPAAQPWHEQAVAALAFAPGQRLLASGGQGREVLLHRAGALREQAGTVKTEQNTLALAFGPAGRWLAIAQGQKADARTPAGLVAMRDMRTGRETLLRKHSSPVVAVAFDPGGDRLATGGSDGAVVLWRSEGWEAERTLRVKSGRVTGVAFGPRGELVAACTDKGEVHLWQAGSGALVRTMRSEGMQDEDASPGLSGIAFRPDGKQLACAARDSSVALFDLATGKAGFPLVGHTGAAHAVAYSPDGRRLATGGADGTVRLWDPERGDEVLTLRDHKQEVLAVAFSSDGRYLASGGKDNAVIVRDAPP